VAQEEAIKLFEGQQVRYVWDDEKEKYFFSVVDVIQVLTDSVDGRKYWNKLKQRLKEEGNQTVTNCHQLKLTAADGKQRLTDVADTEQNSNKVSKKWGSVQVRTRRCQHEHTLSIH